MDAPNVWVVDDDEAYLELLAIALEPRCGAQGVRTFAKPEEAVRWLCTPGPWRLPDLLVLDYHMPGMNGLAAMRALRQAGIDRPVAILSTAASAQERRTCLDEGAIAFVQKPARFEDLMPTLIALIDASIAHPGGRGVEGP